MNKCIIYPQENGVVAIVYPSQEWMGTMEELAAKTVPAGTSYQVVDTSEIPLDRAFRNAWEYQP